MFFNTPLLKGDIAVRDYVQELAQKQNRNVLIITDGTLVYENMPDVNIKTIKLNELDEFNSNENLIFELDEYLEKNGVILIRIYDNVIEVSVEDMINYLYCKTRGLFIIQLTDEVDEEIKHRDEVDLGEYLWLENEE